MKFFLLTLLLAISSELFAMELPKGWEYPSQEELSSDPNRKNSPSKYAKVVADLNNDGKNDMALLLKSTEFSGERLLARLSMPGGYKWLVLETINWGEKYPKVKLAMGLDLAKPGKYKTACAKGYWECGPSEPKELDLEYPGLWYFRFESAASIFYWSKEKGAFVRVWVSD
jgi:hypothetical protein